MSQTAPHTILRQLYWLPVPRRIEFKILLLTFKCLHGLAPAYLEELLTKYKPSRSLRSSEELLLEEPRSRLISYGNMAFQCAAPRLWNKLPKELRATEDVLVFKKDLKSFLFG